MEDPGECGRQIVKCYTEYGQDIPSDNAHNFVMVAFVWVISCSPIGLIWFIHPYPSGLLHLLWGSCTSDIEVTLIHMGRIVKPSKHDKIQLSVKCALIFFHVYFYFLQIQYKIIGQWCRFWVSGCIQKRLLWNYLLWNKVFQVQDYLDFRFGCHVHPAA